MKYLLFLLPSVLSIKALTQNNKYNPEQTYPVSLLQEDFRVMRSQLEAVHIGLYEYTPQVEFNHFLDSIYNSLDEPVTARSFFRKIAPISSKIGNGHTVIAPSTKSLEYDANFQKVLPMAVRYIRDDLYILRNLSDDVSLMDGSQILQINGVSAKKIKDQLMLNETRDGYNETYPLASLNRFFPQKYGRHFGYPPVFALQIRNPAGQLENIQLKALGAKKILEHRKSRYAVKRLLPLREFRILDAESTAVMAIRTFNMERFNKNAINYKRWLKQCFSIIQEKQIKNLVLDLRGNGGGDDGPGPLLFSYLYDKSFSYYKAVHAITNKIRQPEYYQNKLFWPNLVMPLKLRETPDGYTLKNNPGYGLFTPQKQPFTGNLYVLVDGDCFSACGELAGCMAHYQRGIFIGEEVGGNGYVNTSNIMLRLILPNTRTQVVIPVFQYVMNYLPQTKGRGVLPDHPVQPGIDDLLSQKDAVWEYTMHLISSQSITDVHRSP